MWRLIASPSPVPAPVILATGWNWNTFVSTLIATITGAAISATFAWLIFVNGRRDARASRLDDALADLLDTVAEKQAILVTPAAGGNEHIAKSLSNVMEQNMAAAKVVVRARRSDLAVAVELLPALSRIGKMEWSEQLAPLLYFVEIISFWRSGQRAPRGVIEMLRGLPGIAVDGRPEDLNETEHPARHRAPSAEPFPPQPEGIEETAQVRAEPEAP